MLFKRGPGPVKPLSPTLPGVGQNAAQSFMQSLLQPEGHLPKTVRFSALVLRAWPPKSHLHPRPRRGFWRVFACQPKGPGGIPRGDHKAASHPVPGGVLAGTRLIGPGDA